MKVLLKLGQWLKQDILLELDNRISCLDLFTTVNYLKVLILYVWTDKVFSDLAEETNFIFSVESETAYLE